MTDFESWSKESLVMFARDATERMAQQKGEIAALRSQAPMLARWRAQKAEIDVLRSDLRAAMDAYRALVTRGEVSRQSSASP